MRLKILVAAIGAAGLAWLAAPSVAAAAGPAIPHAQKAGDFAPLEDVHWRRWRHRHCWWHRHKHRWHRHCRWHGGHGGIIIIL
jgi:hypothetical protein